VIFAKLYSPEDLGLFQTYFGLSMVLSVVICMRFEMAIFLPEKKDQAIQLVYACFAISAIITIILWILFYFFNFLIVAYFGVQMTSYIVLLPLTVFIIGASQIINYWCNREEEYKLLSSNRIFRAIYSLGASISLFKFKAWGLILGDTIGQLLSVLSISALLNRKRKTPLAKPDFVEMKHLIKRYNQFPLYNVPSGLLEKVSSNLPSLLFLSYFSPATLGFFALTQRIIGLPGALIARSYGDVFRQQASVIFRQENQCSVLFIKTLKTLTIIAVPSFFVLLLIVKPAFEFVFGEKWVVAGIYAQYLVPMFFLQFIVSPLSSMFLVAEKQKFDLIVQIFLLLSLVTTFFVGIMLHFSADETIIGYSVVYCLKYLIELHLSYKFSKNLHASNN
jgi:O-antigen/teichoic acid export membrane protein